MGEALDEISRKGEDESPEAVQSDHFLTLVTEATLIACRNHDEEKLKALKNAVVHTALRDGPDEPLQFMFLRLLDYLTPLHLVTLAVLDDPVKWMARHGVQNPRWPVGSSALVIQYCVPQLRENPGFVEMIVRDLQGAGLVEQGYFLRMPMSDSGILQPRTTDSGRMLVRYISDL